MNTPRTYRSVTAEDIKEARAIVRPIAKRHGESIHVRKGRGSMQGTVLVMGAYAWPDPALRIEVLEALQAAGFEGVHHHAGHTLDEFIAQSRDWSHTYINVALVRAVPRTATAEAVAEALIANADDLYAGCIDHETHRERNRAIWDRIDPADNNLHRAVARLIAEAA